MNHSRTCCHSKERTKGEESIIKVAAIQTEPYSGDLAGETTTIMAPKHYREFIKPYHKRIVDYVHKIRRKRKL